MSEWYGIFKDLTAGTIGGCAGIVVGQPLDTIKVRLQSQGTGTGNIAQGMPYKGPIDALFKMIKYEGYSSLFKGLLPPLIGNAPMNAIAFGAYGNANRYLTNIYPDEKIDNLPEIPLEQKKAILLQLQKNNSNITMDVLDKISYKSTDLSKPNFDRLFLAGCWSGLVQSLATTPAELIKCQLQASTVPISTYDCFSRMIKNRGLMRGLFTGWWSTIWRDTPGMGAYFVAYEMSKWAFRTDVYQPEIVNVNIKSSSVYDLPYRINWKYSTDYSVFGLLCAGGIAGIATWVVTYPVDVVKSVIQTLPDDAKRHEFKLWHVTKTSYQKYGMPFFFRGLATTIVRAVPVNAVTFYIYEETLNLFKRFE